MPDGRMKWYDPNRGEGVVEHNGREYAVEQSEVDSHARKPGVPVHFDIQRTDRGDIATSVVLRAGSRTDHTSKRVGDLTGAHHPSEKGQDEWDDMRMRRRAYGEQPRLVAEDWITFLQTNQVDDATSLYAPDAVIHEGDRDVAGAPSIRQWLEASPMRGSVDGAVQLDGDEENRFRIRWQTIPGDEAAVETTLHVTDGSIVEQYTEEAA